MLRWLADASDVIPADEDPRYPPVDLPVPAGRPCPDRTVERASNHLERVFAHLRRTMQP